MAETYNLVLPMDSGDLKRHPHIVVNSNEEFSEVFKVVSFKPGKHLLPPYDHLFLKLDIKCFDKPNCISLADIIFVEKNEYINDKKFVWKCTDPNCGDFNQQLVINGWKTLHREIIVSRRKVEDRWVREKIFALDTVMQFNPK